MCIRDRGCKSDLENLDRWFREFERVVQHLTSGSGNMLHTERISHLLASWPATSPAGKSLDSEVTSIGVALRNKQESLEYQDLERAKDMKGCYDMLVALMREHELPYSIARRKAQKAYESLPHCTDGDITAHNISWDAVIHGLERYSVKPPHDILFSKYLELLPSEVALHLEEIDKPTDLVSLRKDAIKYA